MGYVWGTAEERPEGAGYYPEDLTEEEFETWIQAHPDDAQSLVSVGESRPDDALAPTTLAAWTMLANELLNLDEVLNK